MPAEGVLHSAGEVLRSAGAVLHSAEGELHSAEGYCTELCSARCAENRTVVKLCMTIWTYFHIFFSLIHSFCE